MGTMCQVFPVLESIKKDPDERVSLVSNTIIEEVLQNIGVIDFGDGLKAGTDVSLWRTRGKHRPIIGEFGFQIRFNERKDLEKDALRRAEAFFLAFIPQFVNPAEGNVALQFVVLGIVSVALNTLADVVVAFAASGIREGAAARPRLIRRLREASGAAMVALGVGLALARRPAS